MADSSQEVSVTDMTEDGDHQRRGEWRDGESPRKQDLEEHLWSGRKGWSDGGPQQSTALILRGNHLRKMCSLFPDVPSPDSEHPVTAVGPPGDWATRLEKDRLYKSRVVLYGVIVNSVHIAS